MSFEALFCPERIAVVGSPSPGKIANVLINRLLDGGMEKVFAVNPKALGVGTAKGFSSVAEINSVDLVLIASPAATVASVLEDCGKAGVKAAAIISSGFSEIGHIQEEQEIHRIAAKYNIRYIGPNCAGLVNTHASLVATLEACPAQGNVAFVSQSGAMGGAFMSMAESQGVGVSKFVSYGNGSGIDIPDLLKYLASDSQTQVIALYVETVNDGRAFMKALTEVCPKKPVVVIKSGRSVTGQRATLSHTGSMAGSDIVFDAALFQSGALRVDTLEDMFDLCKGFSTGKRVKDKKVLIVTNSGGPGVMTTDRAELLGMSVDETSCELKSQLQTFLPGHASTRNPVDLTVEGTDVEYSKVISECLKEYDSAIALYIGTPYLKSLPIAQGVSNGALSSEKLVVAVLQVGSDIDESMGYLKQKGIPCFSSGERAMNVVAKMAAYDKYCYEANKKDLVSCSSSLGKADSMNKGYLLEHEAMTLLSSMKISVPPFQFASTEASVLEASENIGFPLVMKIVSPQIIHKSEVGGVILNIKDKQAAKEAFNRLKLIGAGKDFKGVIVRPMLKMGREVIVGMVRDRTFGPVLAFGLGGIYTEVLKDVIFRVAPVGIDTAKEMISGIKTSMLLNGIRGEKSLDTNALAELISRFSQLPFQYSDIMEIDLNPVFLYEDGLYVGDVRIVISEAQE